MSAVFWIVTGIVILAACFGGRKKTAVRKGPVRIDHPHLIDPDDYECSVCHSRFRKSTMACPFCGVRFTGTETDEEEFLDEEEEWDAWDEEDGI